MGKRRSPIFQKVSNLIKISIFIAKMRLVYLKRSTKLGKFKALKHYNSYGFLQEHQFSPSSTPLILFRRRKTHKGSGAYSVCFRSCFSGNRHGAAAIVEVEREGSELSYGEEDEEEEEEEGSVDERAERFIQRFYEEIKRQRRESRMLEY